MNDVTVKTDVPSEEPTLRRIDAYICDLCLDSKGSECHVPGCVFWMHDVPTEDTADALRSAVGEQS